MQWLHAFYRDVPFLVDQGDEGEIGAALPGSVIDHKSYIQAYTLCIRKVPRRLTPFSPVIVAREY